MDSLAPELNKMGFCLGKRRMAAQPYFPVREIKQNNYILFNSGVGVIGQQQL